MRKIVIKTSRLHIVPQSIEEISVLRDKEMNADMKQAYHSMMETMRQLSGREEWGADWKISLDSGITVGGICIKGAPDAEGTVEIGYGIEEAYRQQGYATEAVNGMVKWALEQDGVQCVTAQTEADNLISQKVLESNGFIRDGNGDEGPLFKVTRQ